jgi:moderate conductance mechanosensitive channel
MPFRPVLWRAVLGLAALLLLAMPARTPAWAQASGHAAAPAAAPAATPQPVSADELQHLVATIEDPAQRKALLAQLRALIAAERGVQQAAPATPATILDTLSAEIDAITGEILAAAQVVVDAPRLVGWIEGQIDSTAARDFWLGVALRLAAIFGVAIIADRVAYFMLRHLQVKIASKPGATAMARLVLILLAIVIELLPVAVFAAAAYFTVPFTQARFGTRKVAHVLIGAIIAARSVLAAARILLLAPSAQLLYPMSGETRHYLYIWARRFTNWAVYGFSVASAAWWLGVPGAIYALILRGTILMLAILGIVFVLQNRRPVADWLRGGTDGGGWRIVRARLADTWHVLAIVYVVGTFGVYVLDVGGGYLFLLQATVVTIVVLLAGALLVRFIQRATQRGFAVSPDVKARYPTIELRANRYLPVLYYISAVVIYTFAALAILQAWGIDAFSWLDTDTGRRATSTSVTIAVVLLAALIAWELFSSAIERYLHSGDGRPLARSARLRTLLPVLRTTVLVVIVTLVGLMVLAEIGVNIAPLLAGAGVVGLAVGFASQALLKDLIIGLIILAEDSLAVGEVVDVGKASGVVERITMRAMRMRDSAGALITVPFSEVTTIKNMTRDYAYSVHSIGVLYREDPDKVMALLQQVADAMKAEPEWAERVIGPVEMWGLDRFTDSAQVISIRIRTAPLQQWTVQREFNRRVKKAFDAAGIEMPSANQTRYLAAPPVAPPAA